MQIVFESTLISNSPLDVIEPCRAELQQNEHRRRRHDIIPLDAGSFLCWKENEAA